MKVTARALTREDSKLTQALNDMDKRLENMEEVIQEVQKLKARRESIIRRIPEGKVTTKEIHELWDDIIEWEDHLLYWS